MIKEKSDSSHIYVGTKMPTANVGALSRKHFLNASLPFIIISTNTISTVSSILVLSSVLHPPPLTSSPWPPLLPSPLPMSLVTYQVSN